MLNIIGYRKAFLTVSTLLVVASLAAIIAFGFLEGIDFKGGALWKLSVPGENVTAAALELFFKEEFKLTDVRVTFDPQNKAYLAKLPTAVEGDRQAYFLKLQEQFKGAEELSFQSIGPSVGAELRNKSFMALALVLIGISLYIAFAFRKVFRPVSSWTYGLITLVSLFHDVAIPAGLLAYLGYSRGVEIDGNFIVALLVVMGFSVHDTIVVFDRIRENLVLDRGKKNFADVVNDSVNQTLARSINTSLTLILVLLALYFTGPTNLHYFVLTLLVGVTAGIYSSIFVASPLLVVWQNIRARGAK
ncbi:MAG: protein translocase subunit SecF [Patescibacteria group bacterium]